MSAPMTMDRVVHGAVRRDLARLASALDRVQDGDRARASELERAFANLREQLTHHHRGEDEHVWPWLEGTGADPELLHAMESEHGAMSDALRETGEAMTAYAASGSEEHELEPVLTPHLGTPGWKAVERKLSRQRPAVAGRFFAWVTDGMAPAERSFFRATVPPPVAVLFSRILGRRYPREVAPVWRR